MDGWVGKCASCMYTLVVDRDRSVGTYAFYVIHQSRKPNANAKRRTGGDVRRDLRHRLEDGGGPIDLEEADQQVPFRYGVCVCW